MNKKIVAIGGGENGRVKSDGIRTKYETGPIDEEIIRLTGKENPKFLFLAHSQPLDRQQAYFECIRDVYNKRYGLECRDIKGDELDDLKRVRELIDWADIIYEGGGNTLDMIKLWKDTGFDEVLREAFENGKVMCGVSAGANCWFKECSSDSLKILYGDEEPLIGMDCLGFVDGFFVPHCDEPGRRESAKELLLDSDNVGLLISNCCALEIVDDEYRLITSDATGHGIDAYGLKCYWKNGEYIEQEIDTSSSFKKLEKLLSKK